MHTVASLTNEQYVNLDWEGNLSAFLAQMSLPEIPNKVHVIVVRQGTIPDQDIKASVYYVE